MTNSRRRMANDSRRTASITSSCWSFAGLIALALLTRPRVALAHPGQPLAPHDLWSSWSTEPGILLGVALVAWAYARGMRAVWQRAGPGRGVQPWQAACFAAGLLAMLVALISPLDALAAALFSAHMVQHLVLMLVAAPLLVLGAPLLPWLWAMPQPWRRALGGWWRRSRLCRSAWHTLDRLAVAWLLQAAALWIWHAPALYQAALRSEAVHAFEHACFLSTATLFWWVLLHPRGGRRHYGASVLAVVTMGVSNGVLGALLTFSPMPWYPAYALGTSAWGLTPLADQQLAGLMMWIPAGVVYLGAAAALFVAWLAAVERAVARRESQAARLPVAYRTRTQGGM